MGMYGDEYYAAMTKDGNIKADKEGRAYAAKAKSKVEAMLEADGRKPSAYTIRRVMLTYK